jgi:hypothetical protein
MEEDRLSEYVLLSLLQEEKRKGKRGRHTNNRKIFTERPKNCIHILIAVIYGHKHEVESKYNVWRVVLYSFKRWC